MASDTDKSKKQGTISPREHPELSFESCQQMQGVWRNMGLVPLRAPSPTHRLLFSPEDGKKDGSVE